ncbi:MAG: DUF1667 domain-containing protein [Lentisphaeria bacterium]|jgi:CxxC motif-containing protein
MSTEREIICIGCPIGCALTVTLSDGVVTGVTGNECGRGPAYARQECVRPERMVTALMYVPGASRPLSVKTAHPVPKDKINDCLEEIRRARPVLPVSIGRVVLDNVAGTGVPVVATCELTAPARVVITPLAAAAKPKPQSKAKGAATTMADKQDDRRCCADK